MIFQLSIQEVFCGSRRRRDIFGLEESGDDHDSARSCFDHFGKIVQLDAANAKDRDANGIVNIGDLRQTHRDIIRLGRRGKNRTEADVIRTFVKGANGLVEAMGGFTDQAIPADDLARFSQGEIVLPDVDAFRAGVARDLRVIVDNQGNAPLAREPVEIDGETRYLRKRMALGAEL